MKDYKKILEGIVNIISTTEKSDIGFANICTYIGENCPELRESEDERIRKFLIQMAQNGHGEDKDWWNKCVAWLEKQGQDGKVWFYRDDYVRDKKQAYQDGIDNVLNNPQKYGLEKQGKDTLEDSILDSNEDGLIAETIKVGKAKKSQRIVSAEAKEAMYDKPAPIRTGPIGFDGEPMESKPCEQKPAEQCDTNKEFSEAVSEKIRNMVSRLFKGDGNITSKEFADQFAWELLTLARYEIQKEQKPAAWSEEDESLCMQIEGLLKVCLVKNLLSFDLYKKMCDLLKSLKERVQPQHKQEWSEEDESNINDIKSIIYENCRTEDANRLIEWLMSLKPQPKKEWSEEDEHILKEIISFIPYHLTAESYTLFINWLKSLKDRYTWKPSLAQLNALGVVAKGNAPDDIEEISSLYKDLKNLKD